jgi:hypothetical protein
MTRERPVRRRETAKDRREGFRTIRKRRRQEQAQAPRLYVGKRLFTKDGRRVGNGIIVGKMDHTSESRGTTIWHVITDFGNDMRLSEPELERFYHIDHEPEAGPTPHSLEEWMQSRRLLVLGEQDPE